MVFADASAEDTTATFPGAGTYVLELTADDTQSTVSDTVTVTVSQAQVLAAVTVTPAQVNLPLGATQQFNAVGEDQYGDPIVIDPVWTATGGTIDANGLYTAGQTVGPHMVTATDGGLSGQATVNITDTVIPWPTLGWETATPAEMNMDETLLQLARDYALTAGGSGIITRSGKIVMSWGDLATRYALKSTTKSIGVTTLGLALHDGLLNLDDPAQLHLPEIGLPPVENASTGWLDQITLKQLAVHTAGFDTSGGYIDMLFEPGTAWSYSDGGSNWLADLLTVKYGVDLSDLLFSRVFDFLGIQSADLVWRDNAFRDDTINGIKRREFGSGISANVDALARIGYLYLRNGQWEGQTIVSGEFVQLTSQPVPEVVGLTEIDPVAYPNASDHYGLGWWNNGDGTLVDVPIDAYWSWGLFDSLIIVIPSLDIVIARAGNGWRPGWDSDYSVIDPFITPIAQSVIIPTN